MLPCSQEPPGLGCHPAADLPGTPQLAPGPRPIPDATAHPLAGVRAYAWLVSNCPWLQLPPPASIAPVTAHRTAPTRSPRSPKAQQAPLVQSGMPRAWASLSPFAFARARGGSGTGTIRPGQSLELEIFECYVSTPYIPRGSRPVFRITRKVGPLGLCGPPPPAFWARLSLGSQEPRPTPPSEPSTQAGPPAGQECGDLPLPELFSVRLPDSVAAQARPLLLPAWIVARGLSRLPQTAWRFVAATILLNVV